MASETIKALLMIALFGVLEAALCGPRMGNLHTAMRLRRLRLNWPHRPAHTATAFAPVPVRVMPPGPSA